MGSTFFTSMTTTTSGSRSSETGGGNFCRNFWTTFLGVSQQNFCISPQNCHLFPKISDDLFVIDLFNVLVWSFSVGGQIRCLHRYGGQNPYFSTNSQRYHYSFCPRGRPNSIANFDGGPWSDLPPPMDPPLTLTTTRTTVTTRLEETYALTTKRTTHTPTRTTVTTARGKICANYYESYSQCNQNYGNHLEKKNMGPSS